MSKNRRRPQRTVQRSKAGRWEPAWDPEYVAPELPPVRRSWEEWVPEDWQGAWVETTMRIVELVWRRHAWRMYRGDASLRDDLYSWLLVKAQEFANKYQPEERSDAEDLWAMCLYRNLDPRCKWHWLDQQGALAWTHEVTKEKHRADVGSIDAIIASHYNKPTLSRAEARLSRDTMWTWRPVDPERFVIVMEEFERAGGQPLFVKAGDLCIEDGCFELRRRNGRCNTRSGQYRNHWLVAECAIDGCGGPIKARGLCSKHYTQARKGAIAMPEPVLPQSDGRCTVEGCDRKHLAKGLCRLHYGERRRSQGLPCEVQGCEKVQHARGLCQMHYMRELRAAS